jgi:hypothetical protein
MNTDPCPIYEFEREKLLGEDSPDLEIFEGPEIFQEGDMEAVHGEAFKQYVVAHFRPVKTRPFPFRGDEVPPDYLYRREDLEKAWQALAHLRPVRLRLLK